MNKKILHPIAIHRKAKSGTKLKELFPNRTPSVYDLADLLGHGSTAKIDKWCAGYFDPDEQDLGKLGILFEVQPWRLKKAIEDWQAERDGPAPPETENSDDQIDNHSDT